MTARHPLHIDPDDPRAPSEEVWAELTEEERARWVDALPSEFEWASPPEGDQHRLAKDGPLGALEAYFNRIGRKIYLSSNLPVYYPNERVFAPDLIAVLDVDPHPRERWVVSAENRGLDLALEVLYRGDDRKDLERNVERYARFGIAEYFIYDRRSNRLLGYTLPHPAARAYEAIVPQQGRWPSRVLGLELALEGFRLRLYSGTAPLPEWQELAMRGEALLEDALSRVSEAERRAEEAAARAEDEKQRAEDEKQRAEDEKQRAEKAEGELRVLQAEIARLRGKP